MNHYFTNEKLESKIKKVLIKIEDKTFTFNTDLGVFSKKGLDFGSRTLINALLKENLTGNLLDVGCGYGVIGIILSTFFSLNCDMIDVNKRAVHLSCMNIKETKLSDKIHFDKGGELTITLNSTAIDDIDYRNIDGFRLLSPTGNTVTDYGYFSGTGTTRPYIEITVAV